MFLECKSYNESRHSYQLRSGKEEKGKQDALHGDLSTQQTPFECAGLYIA